MSMYHLLSNIQTQVRSIILFPSCRFNSTTTVIFLENQFHLLDFKSIRVVTIVLLVLEELLKLHTILGKTASDDSDVDKKEFSDFGANNVYYPVFVRSYFFL